MTDTPICTADLYDAHHANLQVCNLQFRCFGQIDSFCGPCLTVATFEDHIPVLRALETEGQGRVLVVDGRGSLRVGVMGDRLAEIGVKNGWRGVIINGAIRDSAGINPLQLGVRALGTTARRSWTRAEATEAAPLSFGGVTFTTGDWVYADKDCVILSPKPLPLSASPVE